MSLQTTRSPSETLDEIGNYVYLFQRAHLVPGRPLSQLQPWSQPVVLYEQTTIWVFRSQFIVNIGTTSTYPMHTVLLAFIAPATLFQTPVPCGVHIPLCMWHNGVTQRRGPEFAPDHREPGFRIGARQVREAIHSHLLARWRVLHERMPRQPRNSLFGQVFVRQYATFVVERLRYLIFEVPKEHWDLGVGYLSSIPSLRWSGSMGRFSRSFDGTNVSLHFTLEFTRLVPHSIPWRTSMTPWGVEDIDDVRNEVVAKLFLETDPPI